VRPSKTALIGAVVLTAATATFFAGPATASLKEVIILETLDVGTPPLIDLHPEERLRMAHAEQKVLRQSQKAPHSD
jgi:hypothetical protein